MNIEEGFDGSDLTLASSPHLRSPSSISGIMTDVVVALLPAVGAAVYFFGAQAVAIIAATIAGATGTEALIAWVRKQEIPIADMSAVVTGLLLALGLPPTVPLWMAFLGGAFAIGIGKSVFGGLGMNVFNPALVGRVFLVASFPVLMTNWRWPAGAGGWLPEGLDAAAAPTPLDLMALEGVQTPYADLLWGRIAGSLGETSAILLALGAVYLVIKNIIDWRIPVSYIATVMIVAQLIGKNPAFHLLSGGLILGACYMATDYVSGPVTKGAKIAFGIGCGLLTMLIRAYGGYPEGVTYAILFMNATVPLLERYTIPQLFGAEVDAVE